MNKIIEKLKNEKTLTDSELISLIESNDENMRRELFCTAEKVRKSVYSNEVYIRGLIELTNYCKNDCLYCGIRKSNPYVNRYRLKKDEILSCCDNGYTLGFRTFVMQGGEDLYYNDKTMCEIIAAVKSKYPDCAVTLSMGEKTKETYKAYFNAGADRYLLRHETADELHYSKLHPKELSLKNRIECLYNLKDIGFQTGCGFMVGSPFQTTENLVSDIRFIQHFKPHMVGIGPFIPHSATPFGEFPQGSVQKTLTILSIIRIMLPNVLLPATTALATSDEKGRTNGILAGANVVMPNFSPQSHRKDYQLYNNKKSFGSEGGEQLKLLSEEMEKIGYKVVCARGDFKSEDNS